MNAVVTLTDATFDEQIAEGPLWLVDFWAAWCAPCLALEPVLGEVAAELAGQVRVGRVDILANPGMVARFAVTSVPTLLVLSDGVVAKHLFGATRKRILLAELENIHTGHHPH
jgi:thioredoxin 1